jgi:8-oxo-dGTP diphosphatase
MTAAHEDNYWKQPAVPRHVIQMLVIDKDYRVLVMHRSNNVRSARNVWSTPSGEHDIGETVETCAFRELHEEYGLTGISSLLLQQYENIAGDEQPPHYHWVISIYAVCVDDVRKAINREPDKHDEMKFVEMSELTEPSFFDQHKFHTSLHDILRHNIANWYTKIFNLMKFGAK